MKEAATSGLKIFILIIIGFCVGFFTPIMIPVIITIICLITAQFIFIPPIYLIFILAMWLGAIIQIAYAVYVIFWTLLTLIMG